MILLTARVLAEACDAERDFIGHVGGDDLILLMQSTDWEQRVQRSLEDFDRLPRRCSTLQTGLPEASRVPIDWETRCAFR